MWKAVWITVIAGLAGLGGVSGLVAMAAEAPNHTQFFSNDFPAWAFWTFIMVVIVGSASGPVFAIWMGKYLIQKALPEMESRHREERSQQEERHAAHWNLVNTNNREDLHELARAIQKLAEKAGCKWEK